MNFRGHATNCFVRQCNPSRNRNAMAVYFTLAVDCNQNEQAAKEISERFQDFAITIPETIDSSLSLTCSPDYYRASKYWTDGAEPKDHQDWWLVCVVQPIFLGSIHRDLVNEQNLRSIREQLYGRLRGRPNEPAVSYRSARFGVESQDFLGDDRWLESLQQFLSNDEPSKYFEGLIVQQSLVENDSLRSHLEEFSPGYVWWNQFPKNYIG